MTKKSIWTFQEIRFEFEEATAKLSVSDVLRGERASLHMQLSYEELPREIEHVKPFLLRAANKRLQLLSRLVEATLAKDLNFTA